MSGRAERGDQPGGGKQSLVEKEFGAPVGPGPWVQRRVDNAAGLPGKQSLVEQTFGAAPRPGAPVQQRAAGGAASAARAGTPASVDAAVAQGVAAPASSAWHPIPIHELFGRRDDVSNVQARTGPEAPPAADRVVAGGSAASLLDQMSGGGHTSGAVQRAPAMPGSSEGAAPGTSQSDPAALSRLQALLTHAGLSVDQQQLPTATLTPADATRILNRLLQSNPPWWASVPEWLRSA